MQVSTGCAHHQISLVFQVSKKGGELLQWFIWNGKHADNEQSLSSMTIYIFLSMWATRLKQTDESQRVNMYKSHPHHTSSKVLK